MIRITCAKCKTILTVDDGFAGGVCRCQHCGAIQTVPAVTKKQTDALTPAPAARIVSVGNQSAVRAPAPPTVEAPLDDLAAAVDGGTHGRRIAVSRRRRTDNQIVLIVAAVVGVLVVFALLAFWLLRDSDNSTAPTDPRQSSSRIVAGTPDPTATGTPHGTPGIAGIPLSSESVVYLVDQGQGSGQTYDAIKGAVWQSIKSLPAATKFQVIFWETTGILAYPPNLAEATPENIASTGQIIADSFFFGQSRIDRAMAKALAAKPAEMVIITGKEGMGDDFTQTVLNLRRNSQARIHTVCMGETGSAEILKAIAEKTGGQFRHLTGEELEGLKSNAP